MKLRKAIGEIYFFSLGRRQKEAARVGETLREVQKGRGEEEKNTLEKCGMSEERKMHWSPFLGDERHGLEK